MPPERELGQLLAGLADRPPVHRVRAAFNFQRHPRADAAFAHCLYLFRTMARHPRKIQPMSAGERERAGAARDNAASDAAAIDRRRRLSGQAKCQRCSAGGY